MAYTLERRSPRKRFEHLLYVEVEPGNGGMVLNFSEHGFAFRAMRRVRPKQEVKFAFNLTDKRRLEGRGRLEWADQDGRVAGMQFTEISDEFRSELQNWLAISPEVIPSNLGPRTVNPVAAAGGPPPVPPGPAPQRIAADPVLAEARRREAVLRVAGAKANRALLPPESEVAESDEYAEPSAPPPTAESLAYEDSRRESTADVPWAATLPPAIGAERKPAVARPKAATTNPELSAVKIIEQQPHSPLAQEEAASPSNGHTRSAATHSKPSAATELASTPEPAEHQALNFVDTASIAAIEAQTAAALNSHAQTLLQHFQQEEQRMLAAFRDSTARLIRESERKLFPIREAAQAQMKSLESSVSSAAASAKVLDQYPSLLERAQQQSLDRFQSQMQEILHGHVMEMRRRSDLALAELNLRGPVSEPRRISTTSGILVTALMVVLLAALFLYRREVADGFIWMGQHIADSNPGNESGKAAPPPGVKPPAAKNTPARGSEEPATPSSTPASAAAPKEPSANTSTSATAPTRDVKSLWADVARGDINAEMTLGTMYFTGRGVTKNCYQARRLFNAAAKKGNSEARQRLAQLDNGACGQ